MGLRPHGGLSHLIFSQEQTDERRMRGYHLQFLATCHSIQCVSPTITRPKGSRTCTITYRHKRESRQQGKGVQGPTWGGQYTKGTALDSKLNLATPLTFSKPSARVRPPVRTSSSFSPFHFCFLPRALHSNLSLTAAAAAAAALTVVSFLSPSARHNCY